MAAMFLRFWNGNVRERLLIDSEDQRTVDLVEGQKRKDALLEVKDREPVPDWAVNGVAVRAEDEVSLSVNGTA